MQLRGTEGGVLQDVHLWITKVCICTYIHTQLPVTVFKCHMLTECFYLASKSEKTAFLQSAWWALTAAKEHQFMLHSYSVIFLRKGAPHFPHSITILLFLLPAPKGHGQCLSSPYPCKHTSTLCLNKPLSLQLETVPCLAIFFLDRLVLLALHQQLHNDTS